MIPATGWKNRAGRLEATASVRVIPITIKAEQFQTNQVAAISYEVKPESGSWEYRRLKYTYDQVGNITGIIEGNDIEDADDLKLAEYIYDDQNQITQEKLLRKTSDYTYDTFGNIRSKKTTYKNGTYEQYSYTYGNASWRTSAFTCNRRRKTN